jgi:hypothetical protein
MFAGKTTDRIVPATFAKLGAALEIEGHVTGPMAQDLIVSGTVKRGTNVITTRASVHATMPASAPVVAAGKNARFQLRFSGEDIRQSQEDGPYTVTLFLSSPNGQVWGQLEHRTGRYRHEEFGELPGRIVQATESPVGTSGGPYEAIQVEVRLESAVAQKYTLEATLAADRRVVTSASVGQVLAAGSHRLTLKLEGEQLRKAPRAGPWQITVVLLDESANPIATTHLTSRNYRPDQFRAAP